MSTSWISLPILNERLEALRKSLQSPTATLQALTASNAARKSRRGAARRTTTKDTHVHHYYHRAEKKGNNTEESKKGEAAAAAPGPPVRRKRARRKKGKAQETVDRILGQSSAAGQRRDSDDEELVVPHEDLTPLRGVRSFTVQHTQQIGAWLVAKLASRRNGVGIVETQGMYVGLILLHREERVEFFVVGRMRDLDHLATVYGVVEKKEDVTISVEMSLAKHLEGELEQVTESAVQMVHMHVKVSLELHAFLTRADIAPWRDTPVRAAEAVELVERQRFEFDVDNPVVGGLVQTLTAPRPAKGLVDSFQKWRFGGSLKKIVGLSDIFAQPYNEYADKYNQNVQALTALQAEEYTSKDAWSAAMQKWAHVAKQLADWRVYISKYTNQPGGVRSRLKEPDMLQPQNKAIAAATKAALERNADIMSDNDNLLPLLLRAKTLQQLPPHAQVSIRDDGAFQNQTQTLQEHQKLKSEAETKAKQETKIVSQVEKDRERAWEEAFAAFATSHIVTDKDTRSELRSIVRKSMLS